MINLRITGPVARITIRRPEKHNALTPAMVRDLVAAVEVAGADDAVKVTLVDGEGPAFCAGFNIGDPHDFEGGVGERRARPDRLARREGAVDAVAVHRPQADHPRRTRFVYRHRHLPGDGRRLRGRRG